MPRPSLRRTTVRGAQLALAGFVLSRGVLFCVYVVLARLVSPADFGRYAAASVITGVGALFAESGMMAALITRRDRIEEAASTAFYSQLIGGMLLSVGALALSPLLGLFFRDAQTGALAAALSGVLLLRALAVVPDALLQRRFSFARRVAVDPLGAVAFAVASIMACASGAGAWGLVAGAYASVLVQAISAWCFVRFRPRRRLASVQMWRELASFARHVLGSEILSRVGTQLDAIMLGRFAGAAPLGQYRNGLRLAQQPADALVSVGAYVLLPALAQMGDDPARLGAVAKRIYRLLAATVIPLSLSLLPLGEPLAVLLLGPRWRSAGHTISGLCGLLIGGAMISVSSEVFKAIGRPHILVHLHLVRLCSMAILVTAGAIAVGPVGVAVAVSLTELLTGGYALHRVGPLISLDREELSRAVAAPTLATGVMVIAMLGTSAAIDPLAHAVALAWILILAEITVGTVAYASVLLAVDRPRRRAASELIARFRARYASRARTG